MAETCSLDYCDRPPKSRTQPLCNTHYRQQLRGGPLRPFRQMHSSAEVEAELALGRRTCVTCDLRLPVSEFHRADTHGRGLASECKPCSLSRRRESKYGLSTPAWEEMFTNQNRTCAICGTADPGAAGWHTDHDHKTGEVRGILCANCNLKLGHFEKWYLPNSESVNSYLARKSR